MTNFYKITNANGKSIICVGTDHAELFNLFPQNWLNQISAFSLTHAFHEHDIITVNNNEDDQVVYSQRGEVADGSASANPMNPEQKVKGDILSLQSAFLKIGKFEQTLNFLHK